jgi:hypothetical protein
MNDIFAYKVVAPYRGQNGVFVSCYVPYPLSTEYQIGVKSYPAVEGTPLFAFSYLEYAVRFAGKRDNGDIILKCEFEPMFVVRSTMIRPMCLRESSAKSIQIFWASKPDDEDYPFFPLEPFIIGTLLVKWLKPIEIVGG